MCGFSLNPPPPPPPPPLEISSFVSKSTACAFMRAHCMRARFRDRSRPCFIACRGDVHSNFNMQASVIVAERARPLGEASWLTAVVQARSGRVISVQNSEHSFCSKRRNDEEKSFNGHPVLPAKRGASRQSHRFSGRLEYGEGISERNPASRPADWSKSSSFDVRTSGRCWAAANRSPAADIVWELWSSYS